MGGVGGSVVYCTGRGEVFVDEALNDHRSCTCSYQHDQYWDVKVNFGDPRHRDQRQCEVTWSDGRSLQNQW